MLLLLLSACALFSVSDLPTDLPATAADHCAPAMAVEVVTIGEDGRTLRQPLADGLTLAVGEANGLFLTDLDVSVNPTSSRGCVFEASVADVPGVGDRAASVSRSVSSMTAKEDGCLAHREWQDGIDLGTESGGGIAAIEGLKTMTASLTCPEEAVLAISAEVELVLFDPYAVYEQPESWSDSEVDSDLEGD